MNSLKNSVTLIGRIGKDIEVKTTEAGKSVANFSLATNEKYTNNKGEKVEDTQWHDIVMWGKPAENAASLLSKGSQVAIAGKLIHRTYEKDGITRYITEVQAFEFLSLDSTTKEG